MTGVKLYTGKPKKVCGKCRRPIERDGQTVATEEVGLRWIRQQVLPYSQGYVQIIVELRCPLCKHIDRIDWIEPVKEN